MANYDVRHGVVELTRAGQSTRMVSQLWYEDWIDSYMLQGKQQVHVCLRFGLGFFFGRFLRSSYAKQGEQCYTLTWHPTRKDSQRFLWDIFSFNAECFGKWMGKRAKQLHEPRRPHTEQERAAVLDPAAKSAQGYTLTIHCHQLKSPLKGMKKEN